MSSSRHPSRRVSARRGRSRPSGPPIVRSRLASWLRIPLVAMFGSQLVAFALFHAAEIAFKDHWIFAQLRQLSYVEAGNMRRSLEHRLSDEAAAAKVLFVDISGLPKVDIEGKQGELHGQPIGYTPRETLTKLLARIAECQPAAIGFDVDFSADPNPNVHGGAAPAGHLDFLEACLLIAGKRPFDRAMDADFLDLISTKALPRHPIPVFLGVRRSMLQPKPEDWLGGARYAPLAAAISVFSDIRLAPPVYSLIPRTITVQTGGRSEIPLPSLSYSLVKALRSEPEAESKSKVGMGYDLFFARYSQTTRTVSGSNKKAVVDAYFYNTHLISDVAVRNSPALLPGDFLAHPLQPPADIVRRKIRGNIVLVGSADLERASDKHIVPGENILVPGVYLHAAGVLTLLRSPLAQLKAGWGIALSIGLVLLADALVYGLFHGRGYSFVRLHLIQLLVTVLLIIAVSWAIAAVFNAIWLAWLAAIVGACWETAFKLYTTEPLDAASAHPHP